MSYYNNNEKDFLRDTIRDYIVNQKNADLPVKISDILSDLMEVITSGIVAGVAQIEDK